MDRKQLVAQRAREYFGERLEDVYQMVLQDRQEMRGWQEPAHVRAAVRRSIRENATNENDSATVTYAVAEFGRGAAEPDRGQQREAMGQILEAGAHALYKVIRNQTHEINNEELIGLESTLLLYGRPALQITEGRLASAPPYWNILEDQREDIEVVQRGVGRIELFGHPEFDWAGTGFLVSENCLMTTRRTAEIFIENRNNQWQFRPNISAWMDYRSQYQGVAPAGYRVRGVFGVHDKYDLALLDVEPPQYSTDAPTPLALATQPPTPLEGRPVYVVGYPARDARRSEPTTISRIFRDVYNVKRLQPGMLRGNWQFQDIYLLNHDCAQLGQWSGAPLVDLETHQVLGLHLYSRYLETGTAIPLWTLRDDPLFRRANVNFAESNGRQLGSTTRQLERLARSRYWNEVRDMISNTYRRAFGEQWNNYPNP